MNTARLSYRNIAFVGIVGGALLLSYNGNREVDTEAMRDVSVSIRAISHVSTDSYGDSVWAPSSGSGFLVSSETCEVWTNHHVIDDAAVVEVFPRGWQKSHGIPARVINATPQLDVAILQMESCDNMPVARLGDSDLVTTGDETFVVGNPFGRNPDSVSRGIISHTERYLASPAPYFQTDAAVNPGNSGGALFNHKGVVIGLTTAIANNKSGSNVGIGYALPLNDVVDVVAKLRNGPPSWGDAGIKGVLAALTAEEAAIFNVPNGGAAVSVMRSPETGPSKDLIRARDVIYEVDGKPITNPSHVHRIINAKAPGEEVTFSLIRDGKVANVAVNLTNGWNQAETDHKAEEYKGLLGMKVEMWTEQDGFRGQYSSPVITKIHSMGPAHRGFIVSSQSSVAMRGPIVTPVQLSVRTVTGVVLEGKYQPISDISTLNQVALEAYEANKALLLEIESWGRNPSELNEPLKHNTTAFYRIVPEPSVEERAKNQSAISPGSLPPSTDNQPDENQRVSHNNT